MAFLRGLARFLLVALLAAAGAFKTFSPDKELCTHFCSIWPCSEFDIAPLDFCKQIGATELVLALISLVLPRIGALGSLVVLSGAFYTHYADGKPEEGIPALVGVLLSLYVLFSCSGVKKAVAATTAAAGKGKKQH